MGERAHGEEVDSRVGDLAGELQGQATEASRRPRPGAIRDRLSMVRGPCRRAGSGPPRVERVDELVQMVTSTWTARSG